MSRIGKRPISIPQGVTVAMSNRTLTVKGPKGELTKPVNESYVSITVNDSEVVVEKKLNSKEASAHWGTYASHLRNMVQGVSEGYDRKLIIEGVGYKAEVRGSELVLNLGYSHPINLPIPAGISVVVEKNMITLSGFDKESIGQFAAHIRSYREPEPYKGKGIRYDDEIVRRKEGKKSV